jgi:hypothetical protein
MAANPAGTTPEREVPCTVVWPTIGALRLGRLVGALAGIKWGIGPFTLGRLLALATIPISLTVFCWQLTPWVCRRYALTSRRIIIQKGLSAVEGPAIGLERFDTIEVAVLPGQQWLRTGEVIFRHQGEEIFRLRGVPQPEIFRQMCLKVRRALASTGQLTEAQAAAEQPV